MNIFDQLNDLVFSKKRKCLNNVDHESEYVPFMINRWISMISPQHAEIVNNTVNWMYGVFEDKQMHYKLLHNIIPRTRWHRVLYHKKNKDKQDNKSEDTEHIKRLACALELSEREVKYLSQHDEQHTC